MDHKATIIYETKESLERNENPSDIKIRRLINNKILAGRMAGICYMPENYLDYGIQDKDKAIKRSEFTAKSGHYSTYEHGHVTFLIETNKLIAMILNSLNCYSTSEKSARYTAMIPNTSLEKEYYEKWQHIFENLISSYNKDNIYTEKDISKLAMENARYMLSVFTPTVLAYTVSFGRAILTIEWMDNLAKQFEAERSEDINTATSEELNARNSFYDNLLSGLRELALSMKDQLGFKPDEDLPLDDHKRIGIELFSTISFNYKTAGINEDGMYNREVGVDRRRKRSYYGDVYVDNYTCSYAALAQEQRHRTLNYQIFAFNGFDCCYIPKIIKNSPYEQEWIDNYNNLIINGIIPQCTLLDIIETGRFEDWVLKTKERLCSRAQLEIQKITLHQVEKFVKSVNNLCYQNKLILNDMVYTGIYSKDYIRVKPRCKLCNYTCKEPCAQANENILYNRIV